MHFKPWARMVSAWPSGLVREPAGTCSEFEAPAQAPEGPAAPACGIDENCADSVAGVSAKAAAHYDASLNDPGASTAGRLAHISGPDTRAAEPVSSPFQRPHGVRAAQQEHGTGWRQVPARGGADTDGDARQQRQATRRKDHQPTAHSQPDSQRRGRARRLTNSIRLQDGAAQRGLAGIFGTSPAMR